MPDFPQSKGIYQGKISASFTIDESGTTDRISVNVSDLRVGGEPIDEKTVESYAAESLRKRQFPKRAESCVVNFSAWVN